LTAWHCAIHQRFCLDNSTREATNKYFLFILRIPAAFATKKHPFSLADRHPRIRPLLAGTDDWQKPTQRFSAEEYCPSAGSPCVSRIPFCILVCLSTRHIANRGYVSHVIVIHGRKKSRPIKQRRFGGVTTGIKHDRPASCLALVTSLPIMSIIKIQ